MVFSMKDHVYLLLKSSHCELFGDGSCTLFQNQKVNKNMIFALYFLFFHDITGLGKSGFVRTEIKFRHILTGVKNYH